MWVPVDHKTGVQSVDADLAGITVTVEAVEAVEAEPTASPESMFGMVCTEAHIDQPIMLCRTTNFLRSPAFHLHPPLSHLHLHHQHQYHSIINNNNTGDLEAHYAQLQEEQ
ncbi:hypothetical protein ACA910_021594 [Epithemia clementina (nom. ined.)]